MKQQVRCVLSKLSVIIFMALVVTPALGHDEATDPNKATYASRFKIFTAEHEAIGKGGKVDKVQSIFKIDLETGTVWRYRQGVDQKGKPFEEFFEVPNQ